MMVVTIHAEERGEMMQLVIHSEEKGDKMTQDRCDMMIMLVVPTKLFYDQ